MAIFAVFACIKHLDFVRDLNPLIMIASRMAQSVNTEIKQLECRLRDEDSFTSLQDYMYEPYTHTDGKNLEEVQEIRLFQSAYQDPALRHEFYIEYSKAAFPDDFNYVLATWRDQDPAKTSMEQGAGVVPFFQELTTIADIDCGLVTSFDQHEDTVWGCFHGIVSSQMTYEQVIDVVKWQVHWRNRTTLLRGLYWGNFMGRAHLERLRDVDGFIDDVRAEVGEGKIHRIGNGLFFYLSAAPWSVDENAKKRIQDYLLAQDLLMQADDLVLSLAQQTSIGKKHKG